MGSEMCIRDRCLSCHQRLDAFLVKISAGEDLGGRETSAIEDVPNFARMVGQISAIESDAVDRDTSCVQATRQGDDLLRRGFRVIGVDEEHDVAWLRLRDVDEGLRLIEMRLDKRMGHRPVNGAAEAGPG